MLVITGFVLADLSGANVCSAALYDTNLCEAARLRQSIFASALTASGVIALALLATAFPPRTSRGRSDANSEKLPEGASKES
ncbi:hypothetical protein [Leifsonia sp. NPDC077715]|uniref:hypothetical protein n=1 Tax=Leifsonia sp. NPDC077715 TaxID=3155539 RepID=UPI003444E03A